MRTSRAMRSLCAEANDAGCDESVLLGDEEDEAEASGAESERASLRPMLRGMARGRSTIT